MEIFDLENEYIELCNLLKLTGPMLSGGQAKHVINEGLVTVNGQIETRKKCKIRSGQVVAFNGYSIKVK